MATNIEEIKVDTTALQSCITSMTSLQKSLENRSFCVSFSEGTGETATALLALAEQLGTLRTALVLLYAQSAAAMTVTLESFVSADETLASGFHILGEESEG